MKLLISAAIVAATLPMAAHSQTFDFEDASNAALVSSYSATKSGLTLTLTRQGAKQFGFSDIGSSAPGFNTRSVSPFNDPSAGPFVANFSAGLSSFSYQGGDFGPSDDDTFSLSIFSGLNGTGTLLGTTSFNYGANGSFPTLATLSLASTTAFRSAVFNGGSTAFPNSVFYDNIAVTQAAMAGVPEPAVWAMMLVGFGAVGGAMRRRSKVKTTVAFA